MTPLRDGMNLVAKEYVAAQDADDPGVLILSRFAGAAHECAAALLVNPYDSEGVGNAINRALSMPLDERRERHAANFKVLAQTIWRTGPSASCATLAQASRRRRIARLVARIAAGPDVRLDIGQMRTTWRARVYDRVPINRRRSRHESHPHCAALLIVCLGMLPRRGHRGQCAAKAKHWPSAGARPVTSSPPESSAAPRRRRRFQRSQASPALKRPSSRYFLLSRIRECRT